MKQGLEGAGPVGTPDLQRIRQYLSEQLGTRVGVSCLDPHGDPEDLWPEERPAIAKAVARRQREFAAGRRAIRLALSQIGLQPVAIPMAADRSPKWPEHIVGSLAHTHTICVAVVARADQIRCLGIDVESDRPLEPDLWAHICTATELQQIEALPPQLRGQMATRIFCAKEAFYKWQYPLTGRLLDFSEVEIKFTEDHQYFQATVSPKLFDKRSPGLIPTGQITHMGGIVLAWMASTSMPNDEQHHGRCD